MLGGQEWLNAIEQWHGGFKSESLLIAVTANKLKPT